MIDRTRRSWSSVLVGSVLASSLAVGSGGCVMHGSNRPFAYAGNAALLIAGGVMLRTHLQTCMNSMDTCPPPDNGIETTKLVGGSLFAIGALGLALQLADDLQPETAIELPREPSRATANSEDVRTLTDDARDSARAGACADVVNLSRRVSVLDPPYYRHVFKTDTDIASCL